METKQLAVLGDDGNDIQEKIGVLYYVTIDSNNRVVETETDGCIFYDDYIEEHYDYYEMMDKDTPAIGDILPIDYKKFIKKEENSI